MRVMIEILIKIWVIEEDNLDELNQNYMLITQISETYVHILEILSDLLKILVLMFIYHN